jgi:hypothetical protein
MDTEGIPTATHVYAPGEAAYAGRRVLVLDPARLQRLLGFGSLCFGNIEVRIETASSAGKPTLTWAKRTTRLPAHLFLNGGIIPVAPVETTTAAPQRFATVFAAVKILRQRIWGQETVRGCEWHETCPTFTIQVGRLFWTIRFDNYGRVTDQRRVAAPQA